MKVKTGFILVAIFSILAGNYAIYASYKNTHKNYSQKKLKHRLVQNILGINGARVLYGFLGLGLILFGTFILFQFFVTPKLGNEYNNKTNEFIISSRTINKEGYTLNSNIITNLNQLKSRIKFGGEEQLNKYVKISFKNNYLEEIPQIVWKMKNLKTIDLTYNKIVNLNIEQISKMDSLKIIVLKNNPITKENIDKLRKKTSIEIRY